MDSGELLYLAMIVIGLVVRFLKKKKNNTNPTKKTTTSLSDIFEELTGQQSNTEAKMPIVDEVTEISTPNSAQQESKYTQKSPYDINLEYTTKSTAEIKKQHKKAKTANKDYALPEDKPVPDAIDLRQAVIHSVILDRPQY